MQIANEWTVEKSSSEAWMQIEMVFIGKRARFSSAGLLFLAIGSFNALAIGETDKPEQAVVNQKDELELQVAVRAQVEQIGNLRSQLKKINEKFANESNPDLRSELINRRRALDTQLLNAQFDLLNILTEADLSDFREVEVKPFSLEGSLEELVKPLVQEIKKATQATRERRDLEERYNQAQRRQKMYRNAIDSLSEALTVPQSAEVVAELKNLQVDYSSRLERESNVVRVLSYRLDQVTANTSFFGETGEIFVSFFRERGRNALFALLAAFATGLAIRAFHRFLRMRSPLFRRGRSSAARFLELLLYIFSFLGSLMAAIIVLLVAGDWVLMGLVVLFMLALVLTAKDTIPRYMGEIRMMLNIGSVREGERIVFNGVPWTVDNLAYFTILRNPVLRGGMARMPVAMLQGVVSRPASENEPFFPSNEGDWVLLNDGSYGEVVFQSVEMVHVRLLGGALKMYSTAAYISENPQNNSQGFRVSTSFGIDYEYQNRVTRELLENLQTFFRSELEKLIDPKDIFGLKFEFEKANTSSLDYAVLLDLKGSLAHRYFELSRALQRIGVDACNKFTLVIPFQQITLHQTEAA